MDVQGKTYVSQNEALQALTKLPDSHKHHIESRKGADGSTQFTIVDNAPTAPKKGKAAAIAALGPTFKTDAEADRFHSKLLMVNALTGQGGPPSAAEGAIRKAGQKVAEGAKAAGKGIGAAGQAKPGTFTLGPVGFILTPLGPFPVLTPEGKAKVKKALDDVAKAAGPALKPLPPPALSPEAKDKIKEGFREASKNLGPLIAMPGFQEKAKAVSDKIRDGAKEVAKDVAKVAIFGPFLPGVLVGEAVAKAVRKK